MKRGVIPREGWQRMARFYRYVMAVALALAAVATGDARDTGPESGLAPSFGLLLLRESRQLPDGSTVTLRAITSGTEHRIPHTAWLAETPKAWYQGWPPFAADSHSGTTMFWLCRKNMLKSLDRWLERAKMPHDAAELQPLFGFFADAWTIDAAGHRTQLTSKTQHGWGGSPPDDFWEVFEPPSPLPAGAPVRLEVAAQVIDHRDEEHMWSVMFTLPDMREVREKMLRAGWEYAKSQGWREEELWLALDEGLSERKPEEEILRRMQPLIDQGVRLNPLEWPRLIDDLYSAGQVGYPKIAAIPWGQLIDRHGE